MGKMKVRNLILDADSGILSQCIRLSGLRCLSHVLRVVNTRLPYHALSSVSFAE